MPGLSVTSEDAEAAAKLLPVENCETFNVAVVTVVIAAVLLSC